MVGWYSFKLDWPQLNYQAHFANEILLIPKRLVGGEIILKIVCSYVHEKRQLIEITMIV